MGNGKTQTKLTEKLTLNQQSNQQKLRNINALTSGEGSAAAAAVGKWKIYEIHASMCAALQP